MLNLLQATLVEKIKVAEEEEKILSSENGLWNLLSSFVPFLTTPTSDAASIKELHFKLLSKEIEEREHSLRCIPFVLVGTPKNLTIAQVKGLLFKKYGLTANKIRIGNLLALAEDDQFDAEVKELDNSQMLQDCKELLNTGILYLDYAKA
jgi:hypothetical protein